MEPVISSRPFTGPMAWEAATRLPGDGVIALDGACLDEIRTLAAELAAHPLPTTALSPTDFDLPACRALGASVRAALDDGPGFVILDRLPIEALGPETATRVYWVLMSLLARPVAQKWDGTMVYAVHDAGLTPAAGNGVRSSKSNRGQGYHTDNAFNLPPDYVGLLCLRPAVEGGESGLVSFESVHNRLLDGHRDTIERLSRPFWFDRQREHAPDDDQTTSSYPAFTYTAGALQVRLSTGLIRQGYDMRGETMDTAATAALACIDGVLEDAALGKRFQFEPGQIQVVNNRRIGHRRTAFVDAPEPERKRHLVRIWLRHRGRPFYLG